MTTEMMNWLNANRYRSYPMVRDEWRDKVSPTSRIDAVLLDALVFDADSTQIRQLVLERIVVNRSSTSVFFKYGDKRFDLAIPEGDVSGEGSYVRLRGAVEGNGRNATVSLVFSSHAYIRDAIPDGEWEIGCRVLPSRVISLSDGYGVDAVSTNGSKGVDGHEVASDAYGDVVLEDGYRTSPVVFNGKVIVRVGRRYGYNPCMYDYGEEGSRDCRKPLFFFCGQNAVNGGNVVLKGGPGISVQQGRSYTVRDGTCAGRTIPAIEIVAGRPLMELYRPS